MLPTNNSYDSSTSYPHRSSHRRPQRTTGGGRRDPPLRNMMGGASAARPSGPRPLPSPATRELAPRTWDPVRVTATNAAAPLFLPPALSLIHPALYLPASIFVLLTPARNPASLLPAPPSLSPPRRQQRHQPAQRQSHEGPIAGGRQDAGHPVRFVVVPVVQGGGRGGRGAEHSALSLPGSCSRSVGYLRTVIPRRCHCRRGLSGGGSARGGGCRARRQRRKRQRRR